MVIIGSTATTKRMALPVQYSSVSFSNPKDPVPGSRVGFVGRPNRFPRGTTLLPVRSVHHQAALTTLMTGNAGIFALWGAVAACSAYYGMQTAWMNFIEPWVTGSNVSQGNNDHCHQSIVYGIDVTGSSFFPRPDVRRAVEFAALAHKGQTRKTGEPYVGHCIATAAIVEGLLSPSEDDSRAEAAIIAAILHDVMDDAGVDRDEVHRHFGAHVALMVSKISQLSATNQLVRRRLRLSDQQPSPQEAAQLRHMILTMVSEPLVIVIKLADRLHNMRTVYALPPEKQRAVAEETRRVWCSLAERLGMFALKSELEDLCFVVLQPQEYVGLRAELDSLWGLSSLPADSMVPEDCCLSGDCDCDGDGKMKALVGSPGHLTTTIDEMAEETAIQRYILTAEQERTKNIIGTVLPFDASTFNMERLRITPSARRGLEVLQGCAKVLLQEITLEGVASARQVSVQGRVKSLYSTFRKMARKQIPLAQVYDARALRVVVDDDNGMKEREAIAICYNLLPIVHRLWKKVEGEYDDYIALPKPSGYRSLHTAVFGPGGIPMEVQIRTSSMHLEAEYGRAAHWAYKEGKTPPLPPCSPFPAGADWDHRGSALGPGHPVLRISPRGELRDGVVVSTSSDDPAAANRLLVASALGPRKYPSSLHLTHASPQEYAELLAYVEKRGFFSAGQGDSVVALELFTLCSDQKYHKVDVFGHKLAATVVPLNPLNQVESPSHVNSENLESKAATPSNPDGLYLNNRIRLLRSMLEWGEDLGQSAQSGNSMVMDGHAVHFSYGPAAGNHSQNHSDADDSTSNSIHPAEDSKAAAVQAPPPANANGALAFEAPPSDVMILIWPSGRIARVPRGTTAGAVVRREGGCAPRRGMVTVNNKTVPEMTVLEDGDYVVLTTELLKV